MTTLRSRLAAGCILLAASAVPALGQTPPPDQLKAAREVIEVSGAAASLSNIVPVFMDEAKQTFTRTRPEIAKDLGEVLTAIAPEFEKRRDELMDEIAMVYAQRFSTQELAEIKAFYQSPTGAKLVKNLPAVLQQSFEKTEGWSRKMSQDIVARLRQEMRKRGHEI